MADETLVFSIDIQGTKEQEKELGQLMSELDRVKRSMKELQQVEKLQGALTKEQSIERAKLRSQLVGTRNAYNDLEATILKQNNALRKNSGFVAGVRKGVQQWASSMIGITAAIYGVTKVLGDATKTIVDFQQENARLASILGKSRSEITALTEDAKRLGASTAFTATQVAQLQTEFAKLGFSEQEILNVTEATLALAAATQSDLSKAASVAGATVRGFGLNARETQRVVDVMAQSFSTSALDLEKFQVAMRAVAPVAKNAGFSIEQTTAALGVLANNGVRAETAGTGLRNILLDIQKKGITFEEAMSQIANSTNSAKTSMDLFGKENAVVGVVLSQNTDKLAEMTTALDGAGGAAQRMADEQLNTLSGSLTKLSSAWEGFILSLEDGDSLLGNFFKDAIDGLTTFISGLSQSGVKEFLLLLTPATFDRGVQAILGLGNAQQETNEAIQQAKIDTQEYIRTITERAKAEGMIDLAIGSNLMLMGDNKMALLENTDLTEKQIAVIKAQANEYYAAAEAISDVSQATNENTDAVDENNTANTVRSGILSKLMDEQKRLNEEIKFANDISSIRRLQSELEEVELRIKYLTNRPEKEKTIDLELRLQTEDGLSISDAFNKQLDDFQLDGWDEKWDDIGNTVDTTLEDAATNGLKAAKELEEAWNDAFKSIGLSAFDSFTNVISQYYDQTVEKAKNTAEIETQIQKDKLDKGLINEDEYTKELEIIQKKVREKEKEAAIAQAVIDGASAALKGIAQFGPPPSPAGVAALAAAALTTTAQIAIIDSQTFASGGVFDGKSHAEGGIKGILNGKPVEFEGDEMFIANKKLKRSNKKFTVSGTGEQIISALNEATGGRGWKKGAKISDRMNVDLTQGGSTFDRIIQASLNDDRIVRELRMSRKEGALNSKTLVKVLSNKTNGYY